MSWFPKMPKMPKMPNVSGGSVSVSSVYKGGGSSTVTINGQSFQVPGRANVEIRNGQVFINGEALTELTGQSQPVEIEWKGEPPQSLTLTGNAVINGDVEGDIDAGGDVFCGHVGGNVDCSGNVECTTITRNVDCGGDVKADNVGGSIDCGGDVSCGAVKGDVDCGGDVTCGDVKGDISAGGDVSVKRG